MNNLSAYLDFELNISDLDGDSFTIVVRSDAGEVREVARFPYDEPTLEKQLLRLENAILRSTETHRSSPVQQNEDVEHFGRMLFNFVLPGEARSLYNECLREATYRHRGMRLKLSIHSPRLAALPWEFLYDPRKRDYICLNPYTPLVRYTELPQTTPPLTIGSPLRILGLISDPDDMLMALDVEMERQRVSTAIQALEDAGLVELTWMAANNWRELQRAMRSTADGWHVFHFIGHGGFDAQRNEGYIVLGNDDGTSHNLYASQLARLLARQHASMRLVLLNACDSARSGMHDSLSSTAATLINSGIPAVLAMQYEITNDAAVEFAQAFYEALADNLPVDAAVAEARNSISLSDARSLEWGVPVLHMRSEDGRLFSIADTAERFESGGNEGPSAATAALPVLPRQELLPPAVQLPEESQSAAAVDEQTNKPKGATDDSAVSVDELTLTLSQAIAEHDVDPDPPAPSSHRWSVVETIDTLDEAVVTEASSRLQPVADEPAVEPKPSPRPAITATARPPQSPAQSRPPTMDEWARVWDDEEDAELAVDAAAPPDDFSVVQALLEERSRIFTADDIEGEHDAGDGEGTESLAVRNLVESHVQRQHSLLGFEWVTISAGEFIMGSNPNDDVHMFEDELPQFRLHVDDYAIARFPVTNAQYKLFVEATEYDTPAHWQDGKIPRGTELHPVVNVSWYDAVSFCEWAEVRLPTEAEWEKAARGVDGRIYPWGNEPPDTTRCNFDLTIGVTVPVGQYPAGASPFGLADMAGNVWEWTASVWLDTYEDYEKQLQKNSGLALRRVLRGGGFRDIEFVRCASRSWDLANQHYRDLGFRVAKIT